MPANITNISLNWTDIQQNLMLNMTLGFTNIVGFFFWPIVFTVIVTYLFQKTHSAMVAAAAILIILGSLVTSNVFLQVPVIVSFFQIVVCLAVAGLVTVLLLRIRR